MDIAKAFSIIFMIFLHTLFVAPAFTNTISSSYVYVFGDILGRPYAAPIFIFCMGVGVVYHKLAKIPQLLQSWG